MTNSMKRLAALSLTILAACGSSNSVSNAIAPSQTACPAGAARIGLNDGFIQALCGCSQNGGAPDATEVVAGSALTCHVPVGTQVFFELQGVYLAWQIVPTGTPTFPASTLLDPRAEVPVRSHVVQFSTAGTYGFSNAFNSAMQGSIVVQ